jgi:tetratricopeptide (TPR) repeat protein
VELDPDSAISHFNLGRSYLMNNELPNALDEFTMARRATASPATLVPLGFTYGRMGRTAEARATLEQLKSDAKHTYVPAIYFAMLYAGLNDNATALRELQRAKSEHSDYLVLLPFDPMGDSLRKEPGFAAMFR